MSFLITSVLNYASDRLAICLLLTCIFSGALICSLIWAFFFSWHTCYIKGWSLRCSPGWGNAGHCAVMLYMGEGPRRSNGGCSTLCRISVTPSATHKLGLSGAPSRVGGFVYVLGPCVSPQQTLCEAGSFSGCCNPHRCFQSVV